MVETALSFKIKVDDATCPQVAVLSTLILNIEPCIIQGRHLPDGTYEQLVYRSPLCMGLDGQLPDPELIVAEKGQDMFSITPGPQVEQTLAQQMREKLESLFS